MGRLDDATTIELDTDTVDALADDDDVDGGGDDATGVGAAATCVPMRRARSANNCARKSALLATGAAAAAAGAAITAGATDDDNDGDGDCTNDGGIGNIDGSGPLCGPLAGTTDRAASNDAVRKNANNKYDNKSHHINKHAGCLLCGWRGKRGRWKDGKIATNQQAHQLVILVPIIDVHHHLNEQQLSGSIMLIMMHH